MSDWKVSPRNFRPWGGWCTVVIMHYHPIKPDVELQAIHNMTLDLRKAKPQHRSWWYFWESPRGGWR